MSTLSFAPEFSDDESSPSKSIDEFKWEGDVLAYHMPFGKHKGTSLHDMVSSKKTRSYLRWTLANFKSMFPETRRLFTEALQLYNDAKLLQSASK